MLDLAGHLDAMQHHVGGGQQVRQRLLLHAEDAGLQDGFVLGGAYITLALVLNGAGEEATGATGRVHDLFMQLGVDHAHHELGDRARRVELACVAGALQVTQQLLVHVAERVALLRLVEVHAALDLVEHLADQLPGLHVVVGVLEHTAHDKAQRLAVARRQIAQLGKQVYIDEAFQLITGDPFRIGRPVAPTQPLRQRSRCGNGER